MVARCLVGSVQRHSGGEQRPVKGGSVDDTIFVLGNAETVVIVPGYGLAIARAARAQGARRGAHRE
jgi:NAD/NADP transhydrogenase beta subunit